jgi:hypothetical protein
LPLACSAEPLILSLSIFFSSILEASWGQRMPCLKVPGGAERLRSLRPAGRPRRFAG